MQLKGEGPKKPMRETKKVAQYTYFDKFPVPKIPKKIPNSCLKRALIP